MKIYLYETEVLRQKGSALRGMIRNSSTPLLDLLVRESVQNSLDAADPRIGSTFVNVEYTTGRFRKDLLDRELDGISLYSRPSWSDTFIAICDSGTTGLTGSFDDDSGNLSKLVFGIYEAQQASGAGGCWGVGKTVYFRIGTGLVIYYSRIKKENGEFESLMSVAFVEDETRTDALLPSASDGKKYGIAWWGDPVPGKKRVRETHDMGTINRILKAFDMLPYEGNKTGTAIIIPFTDEKALLANNQPEREDGSPAPYWTASISSYIRYSVQKWYSARLCNRKYPGKRLSLTINGNIFDPKRDMEPFFRLTQVLYNRAVLERDGSEDADKVSFEDVSIACEEVRINSQIDPNTAGYVAFAKVNRRDLGMNPPDNRPGPYEYIKSVVGEKDQGKPVLLFCRKPGMAVSYATDGDWTNSIPKTGEDEFLVAYFVLNGTPTLKKSSLNLSLEDYVRKSEQADHLSWDDYTIMEDNLRPSIIEKIKGNTAKKIEAAMREVEEDTETTSETGLSNRLGGLLLPPMGFGRRPSSRTDNPGKDQGNPHDGGGRGGGISSVRKNVRYTYRITEFKADGLCLLIHISTVGARRSSSFGLSIDAETVNGSISSEEWLKETGVQFPFSISGAEIAFTRLDGEKILSSYSLGAPVAVSESGPLTVRPRINGTGSCIGLYLEFNDHEAHSYDVNLIVDVSVLRKDIRPSLSFD